MRRPAVRNAGELYMGASLAYHVRLSVGRLGCRTGL